VNAMDEITLSINEFKALASDTRTGIIKLLDERNHTLSEISKKLELAAPTVKQHLSVLEQADLIQCSDEGRKWKYYNLTKKGRKIVHPKTPSSVMIILGASVVGMVAVVYAIITRLGVQTATSEAQNDFLAAVPSFEARGTEKAVAVAADSAVPAVETAAQTVGNAAMIEISALAIAAFVLGVVIVVLAAKAFRK